MLTPNEFIGSGFAFLLTLVFGFWLSKIGKPYNSVLFNAHKLIALGAVVITSMQIYRILANANLQTLILILIVVTGLCVIALFASGAFMSIGNMNYQYLLAAHRIAAALGFITISIMTYFLIEKM